MGLGDFLAQRSWGTIDPVIIPTTAILPSIECLHCRADPKLDVPIGSRRRRGSLLAYSRRRVLGGHLCGQGYDLTRVPKFPHLEFRTNRSICLQDEKFGGGESPAW